MTVQQELIRAVINNEHTIVKRLLKKSLVKPNANNNEALKIAIANNNVEICKLLVGAKSFQATVDKNVLVAAIKTHHQDTCMFAVKNSLQASAQKSKALIQAVICNNYDACKMLMDETIAGKQYASPNHNKCLPIKLAVKHNHADICQLFIDSNTIHSSWYGTLLEIAASNNSIECAIIIISQMKSNNKYDHALVKSAENGLLEMCKLLIEHKVALPTEDAVFKATQNGYIEIMQLLLNPYVSGFNQLPFKDWRMNYT